MAKMKFQGERPAVPAPTPYDYGMQPVKHSGGGQSQGKRFRGERDPMPGATSFTHRVPTATELPNLAGGDKLPARKEMSGGAPMSGSVTAKSGPHKPHPPVKKWTKKNYSLNTIDKDPDGRMGGSSLS